MNRADLTEKILDIKREKGWTWKHICDADRRHVAGADRRRAARPDEADQAAGGQGRPSCSACRKAESAMLNEVPMRGAGTPMPPTDPLIYRFYELVMVNGPAWKALIEEEFGDGIMSAIDFDMAIERLPEPEGRPRQDHHVGQVPAVQVLRRDRQRAGVWVQSRRLHRLVRVLSGCPWRAAEFRLKVAFHERPPSRCSATLRNRPIPASSPPSRRWCATARTGSSVRINVLDFAAERQARRGKGDRAFLHAARLGLFELSWNVLCPGCGGVLDASASAEDACTRRNTTARSAPPATSRRSTRWSRSTFTVSPRVRRIAAHDPHQLPMCGILPPDLLGLRRRPARGRLRGADRGDHARRDRAAGRREGASCRCSCRPSSSSCSSR